MVTSFSITKDSRRRKSQMSSLIFFGLQLESFEEGPSLKRQSSVYRQKRETKSDFNAC